MMRLLKIHENVMTVMMNILSSSALEEEAETAIHVEEKGEGKVSYCDFVHKKELAAQFEFCLIMKSYIETFEQSNFDSCSFKMSKPSKHFAFELSFSGNGFLGYMCYTFSGHI